MKVNLEIECTPEEARRAMGLPDLTPLHERYMAKMLESFDGSLQPDMVEAMMKSWMPMSEAGLGFWRRMLESGGGKPGG